MRLLSLVLVSLLFANSCGDDAENADVDRVVDVVETEDVLDSFEFDSSRDVPPDGARDEGPDPWTSEWNTEPNVEILDLTPCEEWETVEAIPRALPPNSSPRVLWTFNPRDDPMYSATKANFENDSYFPVVSRDGSIWLRGPKTTDIMQVNRQGTMRRWYNAAPEAAGPLVGIELGAMAALPDASMVLLTTSNSGSGVLQRFSPDWPEDQYIPPTDYDRVGHIHSDFESQILVAPHGMLYVTGPNTLTAICQARRVMWILTNRVKPGTADRTGHLHSSYILPNGTILASGADARLHQVSPQGEVTSLYLAPDLDRSYWRRVDGFVGNYPVVTVVNPADLDASTERTHLLVDGDEVVARIVGRNLSGGPIDRMFFEHDGEWRSATSPEFEPVVIDNSGHFLGSATYLQDGSFYFGRGLPTAMFGAVFDVERTTVEAGWRVEGAFFNRTSFALDETGVSYSAETGAGLVAVQVAELPPPLTHCSGFYCNGYHDRWIRAGE